MNIHEYQAKAILKSYGVNVARGEVASSADEIDTALRLLDGEKFAIKAQIHAGGRGLAGGVKITKSRDEAVKLGLELLGKRLVTPQTSKNGIIVNKIYIEEAVDVAREFYLSLAFDRDNENISLIVSKDGGTSIEELATHSPHLIKKVQIDTQIGLCEFHTQILINFLDIDKTMWEKLHEIITKLYKIYIEKDANLIEINPLVLTTNSEFYALDAKISFDDSALFRHADILELTDESQTDASENEAKAQNLNYIKLDGNVGCVVNGAGLAMATMDIIKMLGGEAANFLDVGGGATSERVARAFRLILNDKNVRVIFVNIFGGIVRCDRIAEGIIQAAEQVGLSVPAVIRLDGTNAKEALQMLKKSNLRGLYTSDDLLEGAKLAVKLANDSEVGKNEYINR
ncbi:ADP-forming succinate--CoA ligase subunit beta [Campylobacter sp. faydin G-24]|uniref:Succinate--CoA ligase [ADP-forming] subunit beta n=1 Tax=Campylobacter anatolicus TaxID=2829105 RepID=A0ABS5HI63_9BACT|nr:ADP-forming succinate--CoA ligase subunit beta [Campylobacter anatolicus]MBR8463964.1 ADP-forming succinate--CoA ligase subunit beta [Campylobacter anatolicus]